MGQRKPTGILVKALVFTKGLWNQHPFHSQVKDEQKKANGGKQEGQKK